MNPVCFSGGAEGADLLWGKIAVENGDELIHYVFKEHEYNGYFAYILTPDDLNHADAHLKVANKSLKRKFPTRSIKTNNLLRRNWWVAKSVDSLYVATQLDHYGQISGGSAWATQMFFDQGKVYCWCLCTSREMWHYYDFVHQRFMPLGGLPPRPRGRYGAIGARALPPHAKKYMREIYEV